MTSFSNITNVRWSDETKTSIECEVFFEHLGRSVPFHARPDDPAEHGRAIFAEAKKLGPAEPAARPPVPKTYSKRKLLGAMTDAQFAIFEETRAMQPARKRAIFDHATQLQSNDPDFPELVMLMKAKFGDEEAARLLSLAEA